MSATFIVFRRDLLSFLKSPLFWLILAATVFINAWIFLWFVQHFLNIAPRLPSHSPGVSALVIAPYFLGVALVIALVTPILAMRLVAGERSTGSLVLLRASPISSTTVVLGKYLALEGTLFAILIPAIAMPITLELGTQLDFGRIFGGIIGLGLLISSFGAISLCLSTLMKQTASAAFTSYAVLLLLWILSLAANGEHQASPMAYLAPQTHLTALLSGVVSISGISYFLILALFSIGIAIWKLDSERLGG